MEHISLEAEKLFYMGPIPITNSIMAAWFTMLVLIVIFVYIG